MQREKRLINFAGKSNLPAMIRISFFFLLFFLTSQLVAAQSPTQTLRGTIVDEGTRLPLVGVTVKIVSSNPLKGTLTDADGAFRLSGVSIGRVSLEINYVGYQTKVIPNVEVNSAKEVVLDITLVESAVQLDAITVTAPNPDGKPLNDLALVSARSISPEQTSRFAGGFNDPSKITSNFAGVATSQDGGNEIIIRGNSPKYMQWRLEGSQISNPNHFGDQNAISGIVNALNNNVLSTSDFYTGAFSAEFGGALSGVYDIRMRKGNNEKLEGIFGLGILGTDITLEGPFKKGYKGSFLVNYRYSTIGLANRLKLVDVEGANLNFQDATFKLWLPTKKLGTFSVFGLQGKSNFLFENVNPGIWVTPGDDFTQTEIIKDYKKGAYLFNAGLNHTVSLSDKSYLETSFMYSGSGIQDNVFEKPPQENHYLNFRGKVNTSAYRWSSVYNYKINAKHKLNAGVRYNQLRESLNQSLLDTQAVRQNLIDFDQSLASLHSFVNWRFSPTDKLTLVAGLHNTNVLYNHKSTLEPRVSLNYAFSPTDILSFGYGNHSTMESVHNYFVQSVLPNGSYAYPNKNLGLLRANHWVAGYEKYLMQPLRLKVEVYYQDLYNLPVEDNIRSSYATLNEGLELRYVALVNKGTGKNYGIEFTMERSLHKGYYFMVNGSLYQSRYKALDNVERNTRYSGDYLVNLLAGKEFRGLGKKDNQVFSINAKAFFGGGHSYVPLLRDENGQVAVDVKKGLIYDESKAYQQRLDNIVNVVASVSYKWNFRRTTHELYLNIDNLTNHRARLTEYYDAKAPGGIGNERQVGIIPNFLYRIYF